MFRKYLNPIFFQEEGKFIIHNALGVNFDGEDRLFTSTPKNVRKTLKQTKYNEDIFRKPIENDS